MAPWRGSPRRAGWGSWGREGFPLCGGCRAVLWVRTRCSVWDRDLMEGVTVSCLSPVLLQCSGDPTLHLHRGGERSLGAGVGLPLPHPRNAVLCTHIPSEPPPAERQLCPWCLLAWSWGFGTCPGLILQLCLLTAQQHCCPRNVGGEEGCAEGRGSGH